MRYPALLALAFSLFVLPAQAQSFGDIFRGIFGGSSEEEAAKPAEKDVSSTKSGTSGAVAAVLSETDIEAGFRQALTIGAETVGAQLSAENGYFGDTKIQIPLPGRLQDLQQQLSTFGLAGPLNDLQLKMNRAAEAAAPEAADLVVGAVKSLTIEDAVSLLNGGDNSATLLLRAKTESQLEVALKPHMESLLSQAGALQAIDQLSGKYGVSELGYDPHQQLVDHAVGKAMDGMFFYLAEEEKSIRRDPVSRTTDLLRRVFGG